MKQKENQNNCAYFRELIIRAQWESLNSTENMQLKLHLKSCPSCLSFNRQIQNLAKTFQSLPGIEPDPSIKERLMLAYRKEHAQKAKPNDSFHFIKSFLMHRIPVYQIILLILIGTGLWQWHNLHRSDTKQTTLQQATSKDLQNTKELPQRIKNHLQIIGKLNGSVSAKDDSTLIRFVTTTL